MTSNNCLIVREEYQISFTLRIELNLIIGIESALQKYSLKLYKAQTGQHPEIEMVLIQLVPSNLKRYY